MKLEELKNKDKSELNSLLTSFREKLRESRFKDSNKQLKNIKEIRGLRKTIAQVLTLLNKE